MIYPLTDSSDRNNELIFLLYFLIIHKNTTNIYYYTYYFTKLQPESEITYQYVVMMERYHCYEYRGYPLLYQPCRMS